MVEEMRYHVTSADRRKLPPKKFLRGIRSHWQIENTLHHVKDRSWSEDKMYSKVPEQGWVLGKLRNQALNIVRTLAEKLRWKEESMPKWSAQLLSRPKPDSSVDGRTVRRLCRCPGQNRGQVPKTVYEFIVWEADFFLQFD